MGLGLYPKTTLQLNPQVLGNYYARVFSLEYIYIRMSLGGWTVAFYGGVGWDGGRCANRYSGCLYSLICQ